MAVRPDVPGPAGCLPWRSCRPVPEGRCVVTAIELRNVSRWYGNVVAVNDITMTIGPGVTGLLGPNGAGKSTLLHLISGFLAPSRGELTVGGAPSWHNPEIYRTIGLVPDRGTAAQAAGPGRGRAPGDRDRGDGRRAGPEDLHLLQGHAAADQSGRRARARPAGAAARRAVQRHGPAAAAAHDGPAARAGRAGPDDPVQLAHPGRGGAGVRHHPGDGRGPARRVRRLPCDPPADDQQAARLPGAD